MSKTTKRVEVELSGDMRKMGMDLFCHGVLPVMNDITKGKPPAEIVLFYCGLLSSLHGAMLADFGKENALELIDLATRAFASFDPPPEQTH